MSPTESMLKPQQAYELDVPELEMGLDLEMIKPLIERLGISTTY
jgi:hypothetical protein